MSSRARTPLYTNIFLVTIYNSISNTVLYRVYIRLSNKKISSEIGLVLVEKIASGALEYFIRLSDRVG